MMGFTMKEIDGLEVLTGVKYIGWENDEEVNTRIREYGMHGIDCTNTDKMGTDFYKKWIDNAKKKDGQRVKEKILKNREKRNLESEIKRVKNARSKTRT